MSFQPSLDLQQRTSFFCLSVLRVGGKSVRYRQTGCFARVALISLQLLSSLKQLFSLRWLRWIAFREGDGMWQRRGCGGGIPEAVNLLQFFFFFNANPPERGEVKIYFFYFSDFFSYFFLLAAKKLDFLLHWCCEKVQRFFKVLNKHNNLPFFASHDFFNSTELS